MKYLMIVAALLSGMVVFAEEVGKIYLGGKYECTTEFKPAGDAENSFVLTIKRKSNGEVFDELSTKTRAISERGKQTATSGEEFYIIMFIEKERAKGDVGIYKQYAVNQACYDNLKRYFRVAVPRPKEPI